MDRDHIIQVLRSVPLFSALDDDDLHEMSAHCAVTRLPKGRVIFCDGDAYHGFYVVIAGSVKVYKLTKGGRETVLHVIRPGNTLAEIPMFTGSGYPAHASTLEPSTLLCVSKHGFLASLRSRPDLALKMFAGLSRRVRDLGEQLERITSLDVRTRLLRWLADEYESQKGATVVPMVTLNVPKSVLAAQIGTIVETLSRTLKRLEGEGLIRVVRRRIFIEDLTRLRAEAEG